MSAASDRPWRKRTSIAATENPKFVLLRVNRSSCAGGDDVPSTTKHAALCGKNAEIPNRRHSAGPVGFCGCQSGLGGSGNTKKRRPAKFTQSPTMLRSTRDDRTQPTAIPERVTEKIDDADSGDDAEQDNQLRETLHRTAGEQELTDSSVHDRAA